MKAAVIHCNVIDGDIVHELKVETKPDALPTLDWLQNMVGGWIELIRVNGELDAYINEEGKLMSLPRNAAATAILADRLFPGDYIAGTIVFCQHNQAGETIGLSPVWLDLVGKVYLQATEGMQK